MKIKEHYSKYQKKIALPDFKDLDKEFEIGKIDTKFGFYFKDISRAMNNKIGYFAGLLEPAINPPVPSIHSMVETSNIEKEDKEEILKTYKRLLYLAHKGYSLETQEDEKKIAAFIKDLWAEWPSIIEKMSNCMNIICESWVKEKKEEVVGRSYTG